MWGPWREGDGRRILSRESGRVVLEDRLGGRRVVTTVTIAGADALVARMEGEEFTADVDAHFEGAGRGTNLVWVVRLAPKGIRGRAWLAMNRADLVDRLRLDLEAHAAAYEADAARAT